MQAQRRGAVGEADGRDGSHSAGAEGCAQGQRSSQRGGCAADRPRASHRQPGPQLFQRAGRQGTLVCTHTRTRTLALIKPLRSLCQDNAIYNLLPDIISRLSDPERAMTSEDFNTIMR